VTDVHGELDFDWWKECASLSSDVSLSGLLQPWRWRKTRYFEIFESGWHWYVTSQKNDISATPL